jgi:hypothetical protein
MTTHVMTGLTDFANEQQFEDAYIRVKAALDALQPDELVQINLDVPTAVATILGVLPKLHALEPEIEKHLPTFDLARYRSLEDVAFALSFANTNYLTALQPPDALSALADEATKTRGVLLADAETLVAHGIIDGNQFAELQGAKGFKNVAQDLQSLSRVLKESWDEIQGKLPLTLDDLTRANQLAAHLLRTIGLREQGAAGVEAATDVRMRAFTLFLRTYGDAQRAVAYLRADQGDAENIAPSLYTGRGRRKAPDAPTPPAATSEASMAEAPDEASPQTERPNPQRPAAAVANTQDSGPFMS